MSTTTKRIIALLFLGSIILAYHQFFKNLDLVIKLNEPTTYKMLSEKDTLNLVFSFIYLSIAHILTLIASLYFFTKANNKDRTYATAVGESHVTPK